MLFRLFLLIVLIPTSLCALPPETSPLIDSLKTIVSKTESKEEQVDIYNKIAFQMLFIDTTACKAYVDTASTISKSIDYTYGIARAYNIHGLHHIFNNRYKEGIDLNTVGLSYCKEDDHKAKGKLYNAIGMAYQKMYVVDKCLENYQMALKHSNTVKDTITSSVVLGNIAGVHSTQQNDAEAKKYYLQLGEISANNKNPNVKYSFNIRFAEFLTSTDEYKESEKYLKEALKNAEDLQHKSKIRKAYLQMAINNINMGSFEFADTCLSQLIDPKFEPTVHTQVRYHYWKSDLEAQRKNYAKAIFHSSECLEIIEEKNDYHFYKPRVLKLLHQSEKELGNFEQAYAYISALKTWQDSTDLKERENKFLELESKYQSEKKEIENALLTEQSNIKSVQLKQRTTLGLATLLTLILSLILLIIYYRNSKQEKQYNEILESKVAERTQKLKKSNEELERFAYVASHDLKEPIRNIKSFTELIRLKLGNEEAIEKVDRYFSIVEKSTDQMHSLIGGIMDYTQSADTIEREFIDLNETLEKVKLSIHKLIVDRNVKIYSTKLPTIYCNSIQIFQIFKNLIENGIKYNVSESPTIELSFEDVGKNIILNFTDNGIGIKKEYREQVFEMFKRLKNQKNTSGSGLGLSIVKKNLENIGGEISFGETIDQGTCLLVRLPKGQRMTQEDQSANHLKVVSSKKILAREEVAV